MKCLRHSRGASARGWRRAAVAETHDGGAAVEFRQRLQSGQCIGHVGFAGLYFFRPWLSALGGAFAVGAGEGAGDRAPEQIGRRGDVSVRGKFVGEIAEIPVDPVDGARQHLSLIHI